MILLDANVLLYAHVQEMPQFPTVSSWLSKQISNGNESIGMPWISITAFLRIASGGRIFDKPWTIADISSRIDSLLAHPNVQVIGPTVRHWTIYSDLLREFNLVGDNVMDAHIAAIAIEHKASVASCDKDFRRFSDHVKIIDPMKK
ncbi:MAG: PIN domain-containing protein [Blastocatellia bacterium]|nr:PIN domain-containing protein [Blastocatellia bacterium]